METIFGKGEQLWSVVLAKVPVAIVVTGPTSQDTPIRYINPEFTRLTGFTLAELYGKNPRELQPPEYLGKQSTARSDLVKCILQHRPCVGRLVNRRRDGTRYWAEFRISPLLDHAGQNAGWIGVQIDVSARVTAEGRLVDTLAAFVDREIDLLNWLLWQKAPDAARVAARITRLADAVGDLWPGIQHKSLVRSARLAMIGFLLENDDAISAIDREQSLTAEQGLALAKYPHRSAEIAMSLPGLDDEVEAIARHQLVCHKFGSGMFAGDATPSSKLSQVLTALSLIDTQIRRRMSLKDAFAHVKSIATHIDRAVIDECQSLLPALVEKGWPERWESVELDVSQVPPGSLINKEVLDGRGLLLVGRGQELTESLLVRLRQLAREGKIDNQLSVTRRC